VKKPNHELNKIKENRNKFAHDEITKNDLEAFEIKSDDSTEIINEEYKKEFDKKVKRRELVLTFFMIIY